jgi:hypothetical protein
MTRKVLEKTEGSGTVLGDRRMTEAGCARQINNLRAGSGTRIKKLMVSAILTRECS